MDTDRELLELAAKAAGIKGHFGLGGTTNRFWLEDGNGESIGKEWNPLTDDGDAFRLSVKLDFHLQMDFDNDEIEAVYCWSLTESDGNREVISEKQDRYAATRRSIVRAAAEIGKGM